MSNIQTKVPWLLLIPFFSMLIMFWLIPLFSGFQLSLYSDAYYGDVEYIGFENYQYLIEDDDRFIKAIKNTLFYACAIILLIIPISIALAKALLGVWPRLKPLLSFFLIFPGLAPPTVLAILFSIVFYGDHGLLNEFTTKPFAAKPIKWLIDPDYIMWALIIQAVWRWTGFITFFILSALESIPKVYYEAASLDGGPNYRTFFSITLPSIKRVILFCVIYLFIDAAVTFAGAYVLLSSSGGTLDAGLLLVTYSYEMFQNGESSTAAAMCFLMMPFLILFLIGLMFFRPQKLSLQRA